MRNFTRNCWQLWRRPAASPWSDESTATPTNTQSHLRLHLHTNYLTFNIYTHTHTRTHRQRRNIKYTHSIRSGQASQRLTRPPATSSLSTELLGDKGGSTAGGGKKKKLKRKQKKIKYFKIFSDVLKKHFYPSVLTSYDVILQNVYRHSDFDSWTHSSLRTESADHMRACEQRLLRKSDVWRTRRRLTVFLSDKLIDWLVFMLHV